MRIIINMPYLKLFGGVSNHYLGLKPFFSKNVIYNQSWTRNLIRQKISFKLLHKPLRLIIFFYDVIKFIFLIIIYKSPKILLNPSFGSTALKRDAYFLYIAKFFQCKVAVFIHGWDKIYFEKVLTNKELFSPIWHKADVFFVLAEEFKKNLLLLKIQSPIYLTTTKVDNKLLEDVHQKEIQLISTILFLSRVEISKGINITIDTFEILAQEHPHLNLRIVGGGNALEESKKYAIEKGIRNISFTGPLSGNDLKNEFLTADLYILPTTHGEGMPTSVLESMAFGLPIISRPVGGLVDFFEDDKMGYLIESLNPDDYAEKINLLINNIDKVNSISKYNVEYAKTHFMASKVAIDLEKIIIDL